MDKDAVGKEGMKLACMAKYLATGICMKVTPLRPCRSWGPPVT